MGETFGALDEIIKISEIKPNFLNAKGVLITTFSSVVEPNELTDYFKLNNRNFLLFDLSVENSGFNFINKSIHEGLFGFLKEMDEINLTIKSEQLIQELTSTTVTNVIKENNEPKVSIRDIDKMSSSDKNELMNKLIDKGIENLSEHDKKILKKLAI
jgi:uncharacterized membrane protein YheB (UPF0754 family)